MKAGRAIALVVIAWLVAAVALGASGATQRLRPPAPQLIIAGLTIALLLAWRLNDALRGWLQQLDLRALIALHLTRFVGLYFLLLCRTGKLACSFAVPAGWGDLAVATFAAVLLLCWERLTAKKTWTDVWNAFGLLDIFFVVANAAQHGMADPISMALLLRLPLSLLPTFLVPLIIASHIIIFSRLPGSGLSSDRAQ